MNRYLAAVAVVCLSTLATGVWAEEAEKASPFDLGLQLELGTDSLVTDPTIAYNEDSNPLVTYTKLGLKPDFSFGKFGLGLDLTVHFNLKFGSSGDGVEIYEPDWNPDKAGKSVLELYLPKIAYVRWGHKGDDLYAKLGSFDDGTLGNGFIMGNYSNTRFLPETRIFGAALDIDGKLFDFPYVGVETFAGNIARLDVIGSRLFVRPLAGIDLPVIKELQIGGTVATDQEPLLYDGDDATSKGEGDVTIYGGDFRLPILNSSVFSLATFGDAVAEPESRWGTMVGFGGKLIGLFTYGAQLRVLGPDFVPTYFDGSYDLFRAQKYAAVSTKAEGDVFTGWLGTLGTTLLGDKIIFNVSLDGPFKATPDDISTASITDYPHLRAVFTIADGILGGFSFDALYEKYYIGAEHWFFKDLVSPETAVISAKVNYKTGPAVLSLLYNLRYDPASNDYIITSSLLSSISF